MTTHFSFNLNDLNVHLVEALHHSLEEIMPDIMNDHHLTERNGYGQFRWNVIIEQLREKCQLLGWIDFGVCKRGAWKTPVLFHGKSRMLITFMTEDTFRNIQKSRTKGRHYLCAGASFNHNMQPQAEQMMMDLPKVETGLEGWIAKSQEQLAASVHTDVGDIEGHILVLFRERNDKLLSVRAVRLTETLEVSTEEEDWSYLIGKPFISEKMVNPNQDDDDEEESLVELL